MNSIYDAIHFLFTHGRLLNSHMKVLLNEDGTTLDIPGQDGRALKIYDATGNVTCGC